jgi:hypothetical protein
MLGVLLNLNYPLNYPFKLHGLGFMVLEFVMYFMNISGTD